jgi:F-type H+-transporting ATPase subunit b
MQINLTPDASLIAIMVIFILNYFVVRKFFLKPVHEVLSWRESEIRGAEKAYEETLARFNAATSEMESRVHLAKREGAQIRENLRAEGAAHRAAAVDKVRREAEGVVKNADAQLDRDIAAAREQIVREADVLARMAAEKIVGRKIA